MIMCGMMCHEVVDGLDSSVEKWNFIYMERYIIVSSFRNWFLVYRWLQPGNTWYVWSIQRFHVKKSMADLISCSIPGMVIPVGCVGNRRQKHPGTHWNQAHSLSILFDFFNESLCFRCRNSVGGKPTSASFSWCIGHPRSKKRQNSNPSCEALSAGICTLRVFSPCLVAIPVWKMNQVASWATRFTFPIKATYFWRTLLLLPTVSKSCFHKRFP